MNSSGYILYQSILQNQVLKDDGNVCLATVPDTEMQERVHIAEQAPGEVSSHQHLMESSASGRGLFSAHYEWGD